jgi:Mn2+/Fe2+ NRAMP family transporter
MNLSMRIAGLCASGAFIVTALPAFFQQWSPNSPMLDSFTGMSLLESLLISLIGAVIAGIIGFQIGKILSKPAGKKKKKKLKTTTSSQESNTPPPNATASSISQTEAEALSMPSGSKPEDI